MDSDNADMIKILFLIHDLYGGGAEKVLVNLVNKLDKSVFDVTVISMFGGGVNEKYLNDSIKYKAVFKSLLPGNSIIMKLFSPEMLHRFFIKESYDVEVSFLEGPCARVISGCKNKNTKLVSWIHCLHNDKKHISESFRSFFEAENCYSKFDTNVFVSEDIKNNFLSFFSNIKKTIVLYNVIDSDKIVELSNEECPISKSDDFINIIGIGKLKPVKGFDRLLRVHKRLISEGYKLKTNILGVGPMMNELKSLIADNNIDDSFVLLGYDENPYKYLKNSDLFVCSSLREGFSTAATEALIIGIPVLTTDVSGMNEMLGDNEFGVIVDNDEEGLYYGIKKLLDSPDLLTYKEKAIIRGKTFSCVETVSAVQRMLKGLLD